MISKKAFQLFLVQVIAVQLLLDGESNSQNLSKIKLNFEIENAQLKEVFMKLENSTQFKFGYDKNTLNSEVRFTTREKDVSIEDLLLKVVEEADLRFKRFNNQILVLKDARTEKIHEKINVVEDVNLSGKITDENGEGLPGVSVVEKGTINGTTTDLGGNYKLTLSEESVLVISFVGYLTKEVKLGTESIISIQMEVDPTQLEEVVVLGYGTLSKERVLGAVHSIKSEDISELPVSGLDQAIAGRIAGVQVVSSGTPGNISEIRIRGIGSVTAGRSPLIVVDGYPLTEGSDLNAINPLDIESIEVLKDAASTAIYGSRGANGVIMITTKTGESEKVSFNFDAYSGFQKVLNPMKFLDAYQFAEVVSEARNWGYVSSDPSNRSEEDNTASRLAKGATNRHIIPTNFAKYLSETPGLTNNDWLDNPFEEPPSIAPGSSIKGVLF